MEPSPRRRCRTLIVEDHTSISVPLKMLVERSGHEAQVAATVAQGLAKLAWQPCCMLLDLMLPDGNGVEVLRRVRDDGLAVRVAVTTGTSDPAMLDAVR